MSDESSASQSKSEQERPKSALRPVAARVRRGVRRGSHQARSTALQVLRKGGVRLAADIEKVSFGPAVATLVRFAWDGDGSLRLAGWAYSRGVDALPGSAPTLRVQLAGPDGRTVAARVQQRADVEANAEAADPEHDYRGSGFTATFSRASLAKITEGTWNLRFVLEVGHASLQGPFTRRQTSGSAGRLIPWRQTATRGILPTWKAASGLSLKWGRPPQPDQAGSDDALEIGSLEILDGPQRLRAVVRLGTSGEDEELPLPSVAAQGPEGTLAASVQRSAPGEVEVVLPLQVTPPWADQPRRLMLGSYDLTARNPDGEEIPLRIGAGALGALPLAARYDGQKVRLHRTESDVLRIQVRPPVADDEIGDFAKARMANRYRAVTSPPQGSVYFDSFYGRAATDSPRALFDELVRRGTSRRLHWVVADHSVEVPDGASPLLMGSDRWWQALHECSHFIHNEGAPKGLVKRDDQTIVQTWHGTPLKRLGADRFFNEEDPSAKGRMARMSSRWDYMIAGNDYSADIFRSAYQFSGNMLNLGYPRNDTLVDPDPEWVLRLRDRLGIGPEEKVLLYAPTWRDGDPSIVGYLDLPDLSRALGPDWRVLVRGHTNTLRVASRYGGERVLDVTTYPQVNELFLASDALITDYSSVMFDYSVTGKPIIFYVPDLDDYVGRRRGVYFDLAESAPGPLTTDLAEVVDAVKGGEAEQRKHAERYRAWQERFNPRDDGHAAARVVDAVFGEGQS